MRFVLVLAVLTSNGCGKQLNPEFCDAHPSDDRCLGGTIADAPGDGPRDAAPPDVMLVQGCPTDYDVTIASSPSRYRVVNSTESWTAAAMDCGNDQSSGPYTHLVVISNEAERQALAPHIDRDRSIGHTDLATAGVWLPLTSEPNVYPQIQSAQSPPWASGEPSGSGSCTAMDTSLGIRDRDCVNEPAAYLCECDTFPHDPNNF